MGTLAAGPGISGYMLRGELKPGFVDISGLGAPHVAFANLAGFSKFWAEYRKDPAQVIEPKELEGFIQTHGVLRAKVKEGDRFHIDSDVVSEAQHVLRKAWRGDTAAIKQLESEALDFRAHLSVQAGGIELVTTDLWTYMRFLFLHDLATGRARQCERQHCATPFFVQKRKGQRYCSIECGTLVAVRNFRDRAARKKRKSRKQRGER